MSSCAAPWSSASRTRRRSSRWSASAGRATYAAARAKPGALLVPRLYRDAVWSPSGSPLLGRLTPADYDLLDRASERSRRLVGKLHRAGARAPHRQRRAEPVRRARREPVARARALRRVRPHARGGVDRGHARSGDFLDARSFRASARSRPARPRTSSSSARIRRATSPRSRRWKRSSRTGASTRGRCWTISSRCIRAYADGWLFDRVSVAVTQRLLARLAASTAPPPDAH